MRKWIGSIFIVLIIMACLPPVLGFFAKQSLNRLIDNLVLPPGMQISLQEYTFGWLSSYASIQVHLADVTPRYTTDQSLDIKVHGHMIHGPLFTGANGLMLGLARLNLHADLKDIQGLTPAVKQELQQLFKGEHLLHASSVFYFTGAMAVNVKSSPMNASALGDSIQWNGFNADIKINRSFDALHTNVQFSPLLFSTAQGAVLDIAPMNFIAQLTRTPDTPWVGQQLFTVPVFYLKDETGEVMRFDHLRVVSNSALIADLLQASFNVTAANIIMGTQTADQLHFDFQVENIASTPLMRLTQLMAKSQTLTAQELQTVFQDLILTLAQGADLKLDYLLNIKDKRVIVRADFEFATIQDELNDSLLNNSQHLLAGLNGRIQIVLPKTFAIEMLMQQPLSLTMTAEELNAQINHFLTAMIQQGLIVESNGIYALDLDYQQGKIMLNTRTLSQDEIYLLLMLLSQASPYARSVTP